MDFKKIYTPEELRDVCEWLETRADQLPKSLRLDRATFISDLPHTVAQLLSLAKLHYKNPTYGGQLLLLFKIREKMMEAEG